MIECDGSLIPVKGWPGDEYSMQINNLHAIEGKEASPEIATSPGGGDVLQPPGY